MINRLANDFPFDALYDRFGVHFDRKSLHDVVKEALQCVDAPKIYVTCNLNHLRVLQGDIEFRRAYENAAVITLDSRPIQIFSRIRFGQRLPLVTGAQLFDVLIDRLMPGRDRPFFVASSLDTGERLCQRLIERNFDHEALAYVSPPFGFQKDGDYSQALLAKMREHRTTHLFMGVGAPKSELWVSRHLSDLPSAHIFCVGAALDFTSGLKIRAPAWLSRLGFEWLHRLLSEPQRLLPRYAGDAVLLANILRGQKLVKVSPVPDQDR